MFDKTNKVFMFNIFMFLYHFTCIDVSFYFLVHCIYSLFSKWRPSAILDFENLSKMQIVAYFYVDVENLVKIEQSAAELLRVFDFQNGGRPPSWFLA